MRPTAWPTVFGLVLGAAALGWLLAARAYGDLVALPLATPITALVIAGFEGGLARVISRKIRHVGHGRVMHPFQIARAAVLAKASSATGALLTGFYAGFALWAIAHSELKAATRDAGVAAASAVACLLLLAAAILLERACRTPVAHDEMPS